MKSPVTKEELSRFDGLYHRLIGTNFGSEVEYPDELKSLAATDISVLSLACGDPQIMIREIADRLKIPNSTLTSAINRLEKAGLAERVISRRDRRSFSLTITEKGRAVQQMHLDFEKEFFGLILSRLPSSRERTDLMNLIETILNDGRRAEGGGESYDERL